MYIQNSIMPDKCGHAEEKVKFKIVECLNYIKLCQYGDEKQEYYYAKDKEFKDFIRDLKKMIKLN